MGGVRGQWSGSDFPGIAVSPSLANNACNLDWGGEWAAKGGYGTTNFSPRGYDCEDTEWLDAGLAFPHWSWGLSRPLVDEVPKRGGRERGVLQQYTRQ